MVYLGQNRGMSQGPQDGAGITLVLGGVGVGIWSIVSLFSVSIVTCFGVGLFVLFAIYAMFQTAEHYIDHQGWAQFLQGVSIALALLMTPVVFEWHLVSYDAMLWAIAVPFALALWIGVWKEALLHWIERLIAVLFLVAIAVAAVLLPAPNASFAGNDERHTWKVVVRAIDADNHPIADVNAQCTSIMVWEHGRIDLQADWFETTDADGQATLELRADTRLKVAFCGAFKDATETTEGYALRTGIVPNPFYGGQFPLTLRLDQRIPVGSPPLASIAAGATPPPVVSTAAGSAMSGDLSALPTEADEAARQAREIEAQVDQVVSDAQTEEQAALQQEERAEEAAARARDAADRAARGEPGTYVYTASDGFTYSGEWSNDQRQGDGVATWASGQRYEGGWYNGERDGVGVLVYGSTSTVASYAGDFVAGSISGLGVMRWRDGSVHAGAFQSSNRHGLGHATNADGASSYGSWDNDKRSGVFKVAMPSGDIYAGQYANGEREGYGVYSWSSGARFEGDWRAGERGLGVSWSSDGSLRTSAPG